MPGVDEVLTATGALVREYGAAAAAEAARTVLARLREQITTGALSGDALDLALAGINAALERQLRAAFTPSLRPLINATGVVLHTNLGRAPLPPAAIAQVAEAAAGYANLEYDIASGERGRRDIHAQAYFAKLFAADAPWPCATIVVNNCAAAVMLALNTLAEGGEVIVSRGELVEIGGSFRIPDVMQKSQALLREVGTTNRTRIEDYQRAITDRTRLLLRVHRSNFAIVGFTEQPPLEELVALGKKYSLPVLHDQGNGSLLDLRALGIEGESGVAESLRAGAEIITYSGDKLLGGPQAGIITGRTEWVERMRANPLFRALRVDKLTYATLEATLALYLRGDHNAIPVLRMLRLPADEIRARAEALLAAAKGNHHLRMEVIAGESVVGGGTAPTAALPTFVLALAHRSLSADALAERLRTHEPRVVGRVEDGRLRLDLRTVPPEADTVIARLLLAL